MFVVLATNRVRYEFNRPFLEAKERQDNDALAVEATGTVKYSIVQYSTVQYSTVQYSIVQYSTVQYSAVQYSTI